MAVLSFNETTVNPTGDNFFTMENALALMNDCNDRLTEGNTNLLDAKDSRSSIGWNDDIDRLTITPQCETTGDNSYHEMYRCASTMQLVNFLKNTILAVKINASSYNGYVGPGEVGEMIHLLDRHLLPQLIAIDDLYESLVNEQREAFITQHLLFFVGQVLILVLLAAIMIAYFYTLNGCYDVLISLMRRIPPASILAFPPLEAYLLKRTAAKKRDTGSVDERIITASSDCIIFTTAAGLVDLLNPSVTKLLGYSPEQLLGQSITSLMSSEDADQIDQQLRLMVARQSGSVFEGHTVCVADDDARIPCWISILGLFTGDILSQFVVIIRDETELLEQQKQAELAKLQSETLLFQILPRDIVVRLNAGEKDISFSIQSATVMFMDIVKFSDYAANLTPQEIMGNLSQVFAAFDESCAKYTLLIKIKLIGDVYMCAGGLFTPEVPPSAHAEEMVQFALDALQVLEDIDVKLDAALMIRIGINTGGPVLAGVLGTDRPTFDIIGDTINVAARLQSTDIPGKVHISEGTRAQLADMDVTIEPRGEVELKGKGKTKTFLIDPQQQGMVGGVAQTTLDNLARYMPGQPR
jgi:PAS domain S-box-containing protein